MIRTTSISKLKNHEFDNFTKIAIVRSAKEMNGIRQLDLLSPNWDLFWTYRKLANNGTWGPEAFDNIYTPRFLEQIQNDPQAQEMLNRLARASHHYDIVLACFCGDVRTCHRSLIAKLLADKGAVMGPIE